MLNSIPPSSLSTVCLLGIVLVVFGGCFLFGKNVSTLRQMLAGTVLSVVSAGFLDSFFIETPNYPIVLLSVGVTLLLLAVFRSERAVRSLRGLGTFIHKPAFAALALMVGGATLLGVAVVRSDPSNDEVFDESSVDLNLPSMVFHEITDFQATTNRGNLIPLLCPDNANLEAVARREARLLSEPLNSSRIIRVEGPETKGNCHGYVFAQGRFWVGGSAVDKILTENGYQRIPLPATGDVVIYREDSGAVSHSGIVRAVLPGSEVLIESKWGVLGTYVHLVDHSIYGNRFEYHRGRGASHSLTIVPIPVSGSPLNERAG